MSWIANVALVVPVGSRALAAMMFAQASGNPHDAAPESFSVALRAAGGEAVTHYACHTRARSVTLEQLPALAGLIPGALWGVTRHDDDTDEERAARPTFEQLLDRWGLTRPVELETPDDDT